VDEQAGVDQKQRADGNLGDDQGALEAEAAVFDASLEGIAAQGLSEIAADHAEGGGQSEDQAGGEGDQEGPDGGSPVG